MYRFAVSVLGGLGLLLCASAAQAGPIPVSSCTADINLNLHCDVYESNPAGDFASDVTVSPAALGFFDPAWLPAYTFVLETGTTYNGHADDAHISDIVIIQSTFVRLITAADAGFSAAITNAFNATAAFTSATTTQIVGTPFVTGAEKFQAIGLVEENASDIAQLVGIFFDGGGGDAITIHSGFAAAGPIVLPPPNSGEVPEPATLSLFSIGALATAARRWRQRRKAS